MYQKLIQDEIKKKLIWVLKKLLITRIFLDNFFKQH